MIQAFCLQNRLFNNRLCKLESITLKEREEIDIFNARFEGSITEVEVVHKADSSKSQLDCRKRKMKASNCTSMVSEAEAKMSEIKILDDGLGSDQKV